MRLAFLSLTLLFACNRPPSALRFTLRLTDDVFRATAGARVILSRADGSSFPVPPMEQESVAGLRTRNLDYDGDGSVDIVVELADEYAFGAANRFELVPSSSATTVSLRVRVEVYDGLSNLMAK